MMITEVSLNVPVEAINWGNLSPTYPYRFNGPAYLYCVTCLHFICVARFSKSRLSCLECGRVLGSPRLSVC